MYGKGDFLEDTTLYRSHAIVEVVVQVMQTLTLSRNLPVLAISQLRTAKYL